jgi:hypothetical protein
MAISARFGSNRPSSSFKKIFKEHFALCDPKKYGQLTDMGLLNEYLITTNIKILI